MARSRKQLWRNQGFAEDAERHEDLKGEIEERLREMAALGLEREMYDRYSRSQTIKVFKSPRGLMAQLVVARVPAKVGDAILEQLLGAENKYPLVRRQVTHVVDMDVLKRRIRQKRLPKEIIEALTKERVTFDTYIPKSKKPRRKG